MIPRFLPIILAASLTGQFLPLSLQAQQPGVAGTAEREIHRRELSAQYAQAQINKGAEALMAQDYESAFSYYKSAVDSLPSGGASTETVRENALDGFSRAAVSLAKQRISEGRYQDAEMIVGVVLDERYNPNYAPALELAQQLRDPTHFNRTITPGFVANVEEVKRLLGEAAGYYQSGRYDLAFRRYEQVLNIDKYNIAARRGMEQVNQQRKLYQETAYNQTRSELLKDIDEGWELPVRKYNLGISSIIEQPQIDLSGRSNINRKLDEIIIPKVEFRDATVREALDFIKQRAAALDTSEPKGVNIVLKLDPAAEAAESMSRITLQLTQVPLRAALEYIATAAGLKVKVEPYAVAIVPLSESTEVLLTKEYNVPPSFINTLPGDSSGGGTAPAAPGGVTTRQGVQQYLEIQGVTFPTGSSAQYLPSTSKLIVRNTQNNLDLIDNLIEISLSTPPTQIEIQAKFLEVSQNNLKELGFDWLLGQFAFPFGTGVYSSGGTTGNQASNNSFYPITNPSGIPIGMSNGSTSTTAGSTTINGTGQLTAGNRSGGTAVRANALDGLLFGSPAGPAAGILSLAGIFTNPQFQVVLRALDQQKGVDLMSAPSVVTQSGKQASIEIVRRFRYPTEYDPPQVPQTQASGAVQPVTPATPSSFETRNLGVTLQVEPTVGPDGYTIDLHLHPQVSEFEGFVNYGSPINTLAPVVRNSLIVAGSGTDVVISLGQIPIATRPVTLTENVINQPIFSIREVDTNVTIYDGQTIVLGGLMREDVQKTEDKTPIIGDIPLVGRLFRTSADQRIKRNLIIFVTANLIDPAGQPLIKSVEDDQEVPAPSAAESLNEIIPGDAASISTP
ncbi:MAG TPA: Amuc_1098 family type IV pilus outer membrane protein [Chthoniobacterales bacterium]